MSYDTIVDRMMDWAIGNPVLRALWVEGSSIEEVRRPYRTLALHLAVDEPDFAATFQRIEALLERLLDARVLGVVDARCSAKEFRLTSGGLPWTLTVEKSSMLAKRPRAHVASLLCRTDHLTHVMDFSLRRK